MAISLSNNKATADRVAARLRRQVRGRKKIAGSPERPRLVVTRSARHLFVQVIDDTAGSTLASASSIIASAMRSLIEPPGLLRSDLTHTLAPGPNRRLMRTWGVLPMVCRMLSTFMASPVKRWVGHKVEGL